eukprot:symbB.v1.2.026621.t1/scaffold2676.1/size73188/3
MSYPQLGAGLAVIFVVLFFLLRGVQRSEKKVVSDRQKGTSMQRLQTEDCARAIEHGTATNSMQNKFKCFVYRPHI